MKTTRIFGILAVFAVAFALLPFTAQTAFADDVSSISGKTNFPLSDYAVLNKSTSSTLTITLSEPSSYTLQTESGWFKQDGESWSSAGEYFVAGFYRYQAVVRIDDTANKFADGATLVIDSEPWTLISQELVSEGGTDYWQGTFASPSIKVPGTQLNSPAPLAKDPDNTELRITWTDDGFAAGYEITVTNVTEGFAPRSTTVNVETTDPLLVRSGGKATYNIANTLAKVTCKDGDNWFVVTVKTIAPEGYEDSEVVSSPAGPSGQWLFYVTKILPSFKIDQDTGVATWGAHPYEETKSYRVWLTFGSKDGKLIADGFFPETKLDVNLDAYIEQFNQGKAGDYWVHVYAATDTRKQLTRESAAKYTYVPKITAINIDGVTQPMEGERAKAALNNYSSTTEHVATMKQGEGEAYWRRYAGGSWVSMSDSETFEAGEKYRISIPIKYDEGYKFASPLTVTVNGKTVNATVDVINSTTARLDCEMDVIAKSDTVYVVKAGALNVRADAAANAERVGGLSYGDVVKATGQMGAWTMIDYEGQTAWVNTSYLALAREDAVFEGGPVGYTVSVGALRVRDEPSTSASTPTQMSEGKQVLATGAVENAEGTWLVIDYELEGVRKLGYMLFSYVGSSGNAIYTFNNTTTPPVKEAAEEDSPTDELVISTGTYPKVTFAPYSKSAIATGDASGLNAQLGDDNYINNDDGYLFATIFPEDAINFDSLTVDKITLPAVFTERGMRVLELARNDDGSITLKLGAVAYEFSVGADGSWTKGSPEGFGFKVNRNVDDDLTFGLFVGLAVDGVAVDASNYAASAGSLDVVLSASYLEGLSAGTHDVAVSFEDGAAETTLTINEKASSGGGSGGTDDADDGEGNSGSGSGSADGADDGEGNSDGGSGDTDGADDNKDNATTQDGKDAQDTQDGGLLDAAQWRKPAVGVSSSAEGQTPRGGVPATGDAMRPGVLAAVAVAALGLAALAASKLRRPRKRPAHAKR